MSRDKVYADVNNPFENLRFKKDGGAIKSAIEKRRDAVLKVLGEDQNRIAEICKRRQMDVEEVLAAGDDEEAVNTYTAKAFSNVPARSNIVIQELQNDLNLVRTLVRGTQNLIALKEKLETISNNVERERSFDLSFEELRALGF